MRLLLVLLAISASAAEMAISPAVITDCTGGLGQATITWKNAGPGPVQVRLLKPNGAPMTGWDTPSGSAKTGLWVNDQMPFVLVDQKGTELARVLASVRCGVPAPAQAQSAPGQPKVDDKGSSAMGGDSKSITGVVLGSILLLIIVYFIWRRSRSQKS